MTALLIILVAIVLLVVGYVFYGKWLCDQWGIDPSRKTPAFTKEDGVDYVAAKPAVLMGHHFSSIAGAGPINGPILASVFGWVPVFLWCVVGGIFFGGLQDFGSLFASIRHDGKSIGEIIKDTMGDRAKKLFIIFALLVLILVIASFVNVVAGTFATIPEEGAKVAIGFVVGTPTAAQTTAFISVGFIILAVIYGFVTNKFNVDIVPATIGGIIAICILVATGLKVGFAMGNMGWIVFIAIYIAVASLVPVWMLLQPRDYLSSYLLYAMMAIAIIGIIVSAVTGNATFAMPAINTAKLPDMFPTLFITVACGACSGFHSLIATGTSSKQISSEADAKLIGYGSMLIESALGIVSLIAVGMIYAQYTAPDAALTPAAAFATGIATMFGTPETSIFKTISALLVLAVSVFALTSLDSATRLSRFMFSELFLKEEEATYKDATGIRVLLAHPLFGTGLMVVIGSVLGALKLAQIWALFGAANQLLAGIALLAVCTWLGHVGKNNKMFYIPMVFMLAATLTSLIKTVIAKIQLIAAGPSAEVPAAWGDWFQLFFAAAMAILAIVLVVEAVGALKKIASKKAA